MLINNKLLKSPILILTLILSTIGFACSSSNSADDESATVNGRVEQTQAKTNSLEEGTVVTMATVSANGSIETLEGIETTTDANGNFSLTFNINAAQNYVVVAKKNATEMMGFISGAVEKGSTINLKPINLESTAETKVFAQLVAQGAADIVSKSDIEAVVTSTIQEEINNSSSLAIRFATSLKNSAEARIRFFQNEIENNSEEKLNATLEVLAEAQARLETDLSAASTTQAETAAVDLFLETTATAMISAGVEANKAAHAIELWSRILINSMESASTEAENSARAQTSIMTGIVVDAAVRAKAEASEMSDETKTAIADAGIKLKAALKAAVGVKADVEAAFEDYMNEVQTAMASDSSVEATFVVSVKTEINSTTGAKTVFESAISSTTNATAALTIYSTFFNEVESTSGDMASSTSMSEANIEAVTKIIILTNLAS